MPQVAFWGPVHGQVATTTNMLAVASTIGTEFLIKTLVSHTHWSHSTLERAYLKDTSLSENSMINFTDIGLDALARFARSRKLEPDMVKDYTHEIVKERLDMLFGTTKTDEAAVALVDVLPNIFESACGYYDLTMIDVNSGSHNLLTNKVLQKADLIIVNLSQNISILERFFVDKEWDALLVGKPYIVVLGKYDQNSNYTAANISRKYKYKQPIFTIPHCTSYLDAYNESLVIELFMRNRNITKRDDDFFFFEEARRLTKEVLTQVGINWKQSTDRGA